MIAIDTFPVSVFRNKYDSSLKNYPFIDSRFQISRLEIWVTNKQTQVNTNSNNLRNIIALQDLGKGNYRESLITSSSFNPSTGIFNSPLDTPSDNAKMITIRLEQELVCLTIFVK
jgi:cell surface protein SprA